MSVMNEWSRKQLEQSLFDHAENTWLAPVIRRVQSLPHNLQVDTVDAIANEFRDAVVAWLELYERNFGERK